MTFLFMGLHLKHAWRTARCEKKNLVLNLEKCHFMVQEGIVLGHKVSGAGIEVDKAKIEVIISLHAPKNCEICEKFTWTCWILEEVR